MNFCLFARPYLAPGGDPAAFLQIAGLADRAGIHSICFGEHLLITPHTSAYPYGPWGHTPETEWMDPLITLSAVAAVTQRIRLSTAVLLAPLRPGVVLAKEVATLDAISGGRVELGIGTGWQTAEYRAVDLAWERRQDRFDDVIETCRRVWGSQPFRLDLGDGTLEDLTALPRPVQDRIPLYYGVKASAANARRIARWGDGWTPVGVGPDQVADGVALIRAEFERHGREPSSLVVRVGLPPATDGQGRVDVAKTFETADAFVEAGATMLVAGFNYRLNSMGEAEDLVGAYAQAARRVGVP